MSFDWSHYLTVARILYDEGTTSQLEEAMYRIAISRAYYALYCTTRNKMQHTLNLTGTGKDHGKIPKQLQKKSSIDERKIGIYLERIRRRRNAADYDNIYKSRRYRGSKALEKDTKFCVEATEEALDILKSM